MFILERKGLALKIRNTICRQGAFYLLQGLIGDCKSGGLFPISGGPVSWYDERNSHPNWTRTSGFTVTGQAIFIDPPVSGVITSSEATWTCNTAATVDGIIFQNDDSLFAAALLPAPQSFNPGDVARVKFTYTGSVIIG